VAVVKPGRVMFELSGVDEDLSREALRLAINKLPIKCKIVSKKDQLAAEQAEQGNAKQETDGEASED
jgi:large subunit ribosomal protein L16